MLHETKGVRGHVGGPVMRGWPGNVAHPGTGRGWSRCCLHPQPKGSSSGQPLLLHSPGVWSPPASPPTLQAAV